MTTERSGMSLEQVRDSIREESKFQRTTKHHVTCTLMDIWANAIDAHLSRDAVVMDLLMRDLHKLSGNLLAGSSSHGVYTDYQKGWMDACGGANMLLLSIIQRHNTSSLTVRHDVVSDTQLDEWVARHALGGMCRTDLRAAYEDAQSFAARHAAVPDAMVSKPYAATVWGVHSANGDIVTGWNACREAMLAQRDGG
jgi:hypothetical protein